MTTVDTAIGVFALIGMLAVALIMALAIGSVLIPVVLRFLDTLARILAQVLSVSPFAKHIAKVINNSSHYPSHKADTKKDSIYIPKPIQDFIYSTFRKGGLWQAQKVNNFKASHKQPLIEDTFDVASQPVENKAKHSEANLPRAKRRCQPKANKTKSKEGFPQFLEGVLFPTLPPYRSDTSTYFFLGGRV